MADIVTMLDKFVERLFRKRSRAVYRATVLVKICFVVVGSAAAAIAQIWLGATGQSFGFWHGVGLVATLAALAGGAFVVFTDSDATNEISAARIAVRTAERASYRARRLEDQMRSTLKAYEDDLRLLIALLAASRSMRTALEQLVLASSSDVDHNIKTMVQFARQQIPVALGFEQSDQWTLCVYKAVPSIVVGKFELESLTHVRADDCDPKQSRKWPEGVGVAGIAYSTRREILLPDLQRDGINTIFLGEGRSRAHDSQRYRSIAAVPIVLGLDKAPWGVVVATIDKTDHFVAGGVGVKTAEAVRAVAAMAALAIAMADAETRLV